MHHFTQNPNFKTMFALRFLRAYSKINMKCNFSPPSTTSSHAPSMVRRSWKIKLTADLLMARAVGRKRAWSRALIVKLRSRHHTCRRYVTRPKADITRTTKRVKLSSQSKCTSAREKLRHLVPGGRGMDFCSLLEETADYIQCLRTQVNVMQGIADSLAT